VVRAFPDAIRDETNFTIASAFGMSSVATSHIGPVVTKTIGQ
jgi:hypothetical protein